MLRSGHYPEIADGIGLTVNTEPEDGMGTVGAHEPDAQVGFGAVREHRVIVSLPSVSIAGRSDVRLILDAENAEALGEALKAAAIECENAE